jgi:predicted nucleic acid-binding protein
MILVDTSAWIDFFRNQGRLADTVDQLLESDDAAVCGPIITEIRRGLRSNADRSQVLPLLSACHHLEQPAALWEDAGDLGTMLGKRGANVKTLDLLIATYALTHTVALLTADADFARMRRAGVGLMLVEA